MAQMEDDERSPPSEAELKRRQRESVAETVDQISEWLEDVDIQDLSLLDSLRIWAAANSVEAWVHFQQLEGDQSSGRDGRLSELAERATSVMAYSAFYQSAPGESGERPRGRLAAIVELWKRRDLLKCLALSSGLRAWASFHSLETSHPLGESELTRKWWSDDNERA